MVHLLNHTISAYPLVWIIIGICADIFVFSYPVVLVRWFVRWWLHNLPSQKASIQIAIITWVVAITNMIIQFFFFKSRPIFSTRENLAVILKALPTASFPSDHAAVSMAIWVATYVLATSKNMKHWWVFWIITSIIMWVARVAVWVHRPTDIIAGRALGLSWALFLCHNIYLSRISDFCITIRNNITDKLKLTSMKELKKNKLHKN